MDTLHKLFSKDTRIGRTVRGALQVSIAILAFVTGLVAIPGVGDLLVNNGLLAATSFVTLNAVVTYAYNGLEAFLVWLGEGK